MSAARLQSLTTGAYILQAYLNMFEKRTYAAIKES